MPNINDVMEMAELLKSRSVVAVEDRCVAVRNRNAKCHKCVDACLAGAIEVSSNKIALDALACVGCGACVSVCPTSAIVSLDPMDEDLAAGVAAAYRNAPGMAVIACARMAARQVGDPEKFATLPCLGRIDESLLVSLAAHEVNDIVLVDGGCETCKYGKASSCVDATLESAISLLEMQGSEAIITRASEFPPEIIAEDERKVVGASRRGFFTQARGYAKNVAMTAAEKAIDDALHQSKERKLLTLRERLSAGKSGKLPTFSPDRNMALLDSLCRMGEPVQPVLKTRLFGSLEIDASACSGCGMCVMFCPTAALKYCEVEEPANEEHRYLEFQVADCTQCGMCVDICLRNCIELSDEVSTSELFDFEPRLIEVPRPPKASRLFERRGK